MNEIKKHSKRLDTRKKLKLKEIEKIKRVGRNCSNYNKNTIWMIHWMMNK